MVSCKLQQGVYNKQQLQQLQLQEKNTDYIHSYKKPGKTTKTPPRLLLGLRSVLAYPLFTHMYFN